MYDTKRMNNELKLSNSLRIQMDDNLWERVYTIYMEYTYNQSWDLFSINYYIEPYHLG